MPARPDSHAGQPVNPTAQTHSGGSHPHRCSCHPENEPAAISSRGNQVASSNADDPINETARGSAPATSERPPEQPATEDDFSMCSHLEPDSASHSHSQSHSPGTRDEPEHVVCNVDDADCAACVPPLKKALQEIQGVHDVKISTTTRRVEFNIHGSPLTRSEILSEVQKKSGFILEWVNDTHVTVIANLDKEQAERLRKHKLPGLTSVDSVSASTAKIRYDPKAIGIRTVLGALRQPVTLAPKAKPGAHMAVKALMQPTIRTTVALLLSVPIMVLTFNYPHLAQSRRGAIACFALSTLLQLAAWLDFFRRAIVALFRYRAVDLDILVVLSTSVAYIYSTVQFGITMNAGRASSADPGLTATSGMVITFVLAGRLISRLAQAGAIAHVSQPTLEENSAVLHHEHGIDEPIDARLLQMGDAFVVYPNTIIPTDGKVSAGESHVDEALLTGESAPVSKKVDDVVVAGTRNIEGSLIVRLTRVPAQSTVTLISKSLHRSRSFKPQLQTATDRVAKLFLPAILTAAAVTFLVWIIVFAFQHKSAGNAVGTALTYTIAVLVVSCPCALSLAVPIVLLVASKVIARHGVFIKSDRVIEQAMRITDVVFDKTGTLTSPELDVKSARFTRMGLDKVTARKVVFAMTKDQDHPVSQSLRRHLQFVHGETPINVERCEELSSRGLCAVLDEKELRLGSAEFCRQQDHATVQKLLKEGNTISVLTYDDVLVAIFGLRTRLRPEAKALVNELKALNLQLHILSGDAPAAVFACAAALGIPENRVLASCSGDKKQRYVEKLSAGCFDHKSKTHSCSHGACGHMEDHSDNKEHEHTPGHHHTPGHGHDSPRKVMFIGDGTNDAAAFSASALAISVGSASAILNSASDVVLTGQKPLSGVSYLLDFSRAAHRRILVNFVYVGVFNVVAIALASRLIVKWNLPPQYAAFGELVSVFPVLICGLTMIAAKRTKRRPHKHARDKHGGHNPR